MFSENLKNFHNIVLLGTTGSGKSTLAQKLSHELNLPRIELDALFWEPNWTPTDLTVFRGRIEKALEENKHWIVDGNYSKGRDLIWPKADLIIWLDYPFHRILWQVIKRTKRNCKTKKELWPGCRESWKLQLLSKNSIFYWFFRSYWKKKRVYPKLLAEYSHIKILHVRKPQDLKTMAGSNFRIRRMLM